MRVSVSKRERKREREKERERERERDSCLPISRSAFGKLNYLILLSVDFSNFRFRYWGCNLRKYPLQWLRR